MTQAASAIRAYHDRSEKPRRKTQMDRIEEFLVESGRARTLAEIARALNIPDSTVSARLNEGRDCGRFDIYGERLCEINRRYKKQVWFIAPQDPQRPLFGESQ